MYWQIGELNLVHFIEAAQESVLYPVNLCADVIEKRWEQIMLDVLLDLIVIPGDHFSLLADDENKTALFQALNMALVIS
ncbi:hypothetical protein [Photorhabdus sp. RM323S]|uniref:hypothetical protein n=1 Tax=Photorhabdus sp. RM323S TaxID=3342828 RepID=UPI0036DE24AD